MDPCLQNAASSLNLGHIIADIQISSDLQSYSCRSSCLARHLGACTVAVVVVRVMHWVMGLGGWLALSSPSGRRHRDESEITHSCSLDRAVAPGS